MWKHRFLVEALEGPTSRGKVRLLLGARQTGKTVLLRRLEAAGRAQRYDLQDSALRRRFEADPAAFSREVRALDASVRVVVVDEIQRVPALLDEVQALHDAAPRAREFFLTGSSARRLKRGSANLLPGRVHLFHLLPITRWETEGSRPAVDLLRASHGRPAGAEGFPEQTIERTLLYGDLPGIRLEPDATAAATLAGYVETYLEEEVRREALVREMGPFLLFLRLSALESGSIVNVASLSRESGIPQATLRLYREVLEESFVAMTLPPYGRSGRKRLLTSPRFYLFDLGLRTVAAGLSFAAGRLDLEGGRLLEHWVGLELMRRARYLGRGFGVSFWRTVSGAEVDFVWETAAEDLPIEVKWTERPSPSDARHIELFLDTYPKRARRGLLVCRAARRQQLTDRVLAVPWGEL